MKVETAENSPHGKGSGALFVGGLAAILASTCCLGPLVLVAVGLSGAWIWKPHEARTVPSVIYCGRNARAVLCWTANLPTGGNL
jgi:MerT mercuric transport protein